MKKIVAKDFEFILLLILKELVRTVESKRSLLLYKDHGCK